MKKQGFGKLVCVNNIAKIQMAAGLMRFLIYGVHNKVANDWRAACETVTCRNEIS